MNFSGKSFSDIIFNSPFSSFFHFFPSRLFRKAEPTDKGDPAAACLCCAGDRAGRGGQRPHLRPGRGVQAQLMRGQPVGTCKQLFW